MNVDGRGSSIDDAYLRFNSVWKDFVGTVVWDETIVSPGRLRGRKKNRVEAGANE